MARYQPAPDLWSLAEEARAGLQPGQWVTAGPGGPRGRWCGPTTGGGCVAWADNGRGHPLGRLGYLRALRAYALSRHPDPARGAAIETRRAAA